MRRRKLVKPARQPNLFHAPVQRPHWTELPLQVRQTVLPLLVKLLKSAALPPEPDAGDTQGGDDE